MEDTMIFIWLAVAVSAVFCETMTVALVAIWFVPAARIAMVLSMLNVDVWIQAVVFFALSVATITVFCAFFRRKILAKQAAVRTNSDCLIGQFAVVTEEIDNLNAKGAVKVGGQVWSARSENDEPIPSGETVEILSIVGVKLICKIAK